MDNVKGWQLDLEEIYGKRWKYREKFHAGEDVWEFPSGGSACLFYGIAEAGISKEVASLAILRNREKPELLYKFSRLTCWYL